MNVILLSTLSTQELFDLGTAIFFREGDQPGSSIVGYFTEVNQVGHVSTDFGTVFPITGFTHAVTLAEFNSVVFAK